MTVSPSQYTSSQLEKRLRALEQSEAELRRANCELQTAIEKVSSAVIAVDHLGTVTLFNPAAERLLGYRADEVLGTRDSDLFDLTTLDLWHQGLGLPQTTAALAMAHMTRGAGEEDLPVLMRHRLGRILPVHLAVSRVQASPGAEGYLGVVRSASCKGCQGDRELRAVIETIPHPVFVKDTRGQYVTCNNAFASFVARDCGSALPATPEELFSEEFVLKDKESDRELLRSGRAVSFLARCDKTGVVRDLSAKKCLLRWADGSLRGIVGAVLDVSEQRATQEELHLQTAMLEEEIAGHQLAEEALRERERMLSLIVNTVPQTIFWKDTDSVYLGCNEKFARSAGLSSPAEIVGKTDFDLPWDPDETIAYRQDDREVMRLGRPKVHMEETQRQADGSKLVVDTTKIPLRNDSGTVVGVLGVYEDISERKRVEQDLKESEERLRHIFDASQMGIILLSSEGRIVFGNRRLAEMFGHDSLEEMLGKRYVDLLHPAGKEEGEYTTRQMLSGKRTTIAAERRYIRKDGSQFIGFISGRRMVEEDGSLHALVGCIADVTELKNSRLDLEREKERLAVTLRSIGDGVVTVDTEEKVVLLSKVAEEFCGLTQKDAVGLPLSQVFRVVGEETGEALESPAAQVLRTGRVVEHAEHTVLAADGTRIIASSAAPILDRDGMLIGVVLVFRDITEKKGLEEEIFKARKLESLGILAGGIAHDFNNLLTGIMGNISLARLHLPPDHEAATFLQRAEKASERSRELTQQLLTFSKGGAPVKKLTSLAQIIADSASFALVGSNVRCTFDIAPDLWPAEIDAGQMSQVISNLVINADQAMPEGGLLVIRAENVLPLDDRPREKKIRITIKDTGVGISGEHRQRIFDPYFTTKQTGSGLGLATVYSIIKNHDGELKVYSRENHGTTFAITLPAQEGVVRRESADFRAETSSCGKILVMDDEETIRELARDGLEMLGYEPTVCSDGMKMLELYAQALKEGDPYRAVIMDLTVPGGMGGSEAVRPLMEMDPQALAIASSGYSEEAIMAQHKDYGFAGTLCKPYSINDLESFLAGLLKEKRR